MLILARNAREGLTLTVPSSAEPTVIHLLIQKIMCGEKHTVRLGITAPRECHVLRDELIGQRSEVEK